MKSLFKLLVIILLITLCTGFYSCNNKKTRSDIEFRPNGYYYEKGSNTLFTGSITEMEGKCKTIKSYLNGERHKVETYYPNGQVGYYFEYAAGGIIEKCHYFYDPDGNTCTSGEFQGWINYYNK